MAGVPATRYGQAMQPGSPAGDGSSRCRSITDAERPDVTEHDAASNDESAGRDEDRGWGSRVRQRRPQRPVHMRAP